MVDAIDSIDVVLAAGDERSASAPTVPQMRRSWIREPFSGLTAHHDPHGDPSAADAHMQQWLDQGWTLHAVTTTLSPGVGLVNLVHTFFWRR